MFIHRCIHFVASILVRLVYRVRVRDLDALPSEGAAIVVANHVTYADAVILGGLLPRRVRFVVSHHLYDAWPLHWFFKAAGAIPIAPRHEDPARLAAALEEIDRLLADGEVVGIFPEGKLTRDGELCDFKPGVEAILARRPVPVVPVVIRGLWGSYFSYAGGYPMKKWPRRFWSRIEVIGGSVLEPAQVSAAGLRERLGELLRGGLVS